MNKTKKKKKGNTQPEQNKLWSIPAQGSGGLHEKADVLVRIGDGHLIKTCHDDLFSSGFADARRTKIEPTPSAHEAKCTSVYVPSIKKSFLIEKEISEKRAR